MRDSVEPRGKLSPSTVLFRVVVVLAFLILSAQLWRLQVIEGRDFRRRAEENHIRELREPARRGVIYDRNVLEGQSRILASNAPIFVASVIPADLPKGRETEVLERLSSIVGVPVRDIQEKIDEKKAENDLFSPIPIKENVDRLSALRLDQARLELPGVAVSVDSTRRYAEGLLTAHLIGYTGLISPTILPPEQFKRLTSPEGGYSIHDRIGVEGLEERYEHLLRGRYGRKRLEVEASGRQRELGVSEAPRPGSNLVLTVDIDLQRYVDQALREGLHNSPSGVAIVMDPRNGEILSLVSQPTFDHNIFTDESRDDELAALLKDKDQPFFNRAIFGLYPPGSTFKLITGVAALQEGIANRNTLIESRGAIFFENDRFPGASNAQRLPEWNKVGFGTVNFVQAIANSSNIYFFILGGGFEKDFPSGPLRLGLGNERIARYARMFGYGAPTGIDLPEEASGVMPDEAWKRSKLGEPWYKGDTYNMSIGQGYVQATPLQVANATNALANGGTLYRPHLLKAVIDANGEVLDVTKPEVLQKVDVSPANLQLIREAMEAGFSTGTLLPQFRVPGLRVAAKTGTGEFAGEVNAQGELPTHGWFTAFAPADDPRISVTVFVDRGSGSKDAGPIAMRIIRHYFGIPEDLAPEPTPTPSPASSPASSGGAGPRPAATPSAPRPTPVPAVPAREPTPEPTAQPQVAPTRAPRQPRTPAPTAAPPAPTRGSAPAQATPAAPRPTSPAPQQPAAPAQPTPAPRQPTPAPPQPTPKPAGDRDSSRQ